MGKPPRNPKTLRHAAERLATISPLRSGATPEQKAAYGAALHDGWRSTEIVKATTSIEHQKFDRQRQLRQSQQILNEAARPKGLARLNPFR